MINFPKIQLNSVVQPRQKVKNEESINKTLEGVLVNTHVKDGKYDPVNFDKVCDSLMIPEEKQLIPCYAPKEKEQSFDVKKILMPLVIGTVTAFGGAAALSFVLKKSSKAILNSEPFERLPELAFNMNILEEDGFATYRMVRDPSFKNIAGAMAVFLFSGLAITAKNFVDGTKEVWIKKQEADIERDLQEDLIDVETKSFSGKLNEVNRLLSCNVKYFKNALSPKESDVFKEHFTFKGKGAKEEKIKSNPLVFTLASLGVLTGCFALGKVAFANFGKTLSSVKDYAQKCTESVVEAVDRVAKNGDENSVEKLTELFSSIYAKPQYIKDTLLKMDVPEEKITEVVSNVDKTARSIYVDAPTEIGGFIGKTQLYCYLNENRGHLYNWIIHPKNKFAKYIFLSLTAVSSIGYVFKQGLDAIKSVAVNRENSKTELDLKKRLVEVEVANFAAKKNSAIFPMINSFEYQLSQGKPKDEMKQLAENILFEIKNGPPYVYS